MPLKNLTLFRGKPLIQWAIEQAQASKYIDQILVSSDSDAILNYAKAPLIALRRPGHLASDKATSEALLVHALYAQAVLPAFFVLLQPTSPLRTPADIDLCLERAVKFTGQCISYNEYGKRNGAVFVSSSTKFLSSLSLEDKVTGSDLYVMPNERSLDIDYEQDFGYTADLKNA